MTVAAEDPVGVIKLWLASSGSVLFIENHEQPVIIQHGGRCVSYVECDLSSVVYCASGACGRK